MHFPAKKMSTDFSFESLLEEQHGKANDECIVVNTAAPQQHRREYQYSQPSTWLIRNIHCFCCLHPRFPLSAVNIGSDPIVDACQHLVLCALVILKLHRRTERFGIEDVITQQQSF